MYITVEIVDKDIWTALHNPDLADCKDDTCTGALKWSEDGGTTQGTYTYESFSKEVKGKPSDACVKFKKDKTVDEAKCSKNKVAVCRILRE